MKSSLATRFVPHLDTLEDRSVPSTFDWFQSNLADPSLRALAEARYADQSLSRNDMIAIFRQAAKDGTVSEEEYGDLETLIENGPDLGIPDHVQALAEKVAYWDPANDWYQGDYLGGLEPDSPGQVLDKLVDKWFYGKDHPRAPRGGSLGLLDRFFAGGVDYKYRSAKGKLFVKGPSANDVRQGNLDDDAFLSALAATAAQSPQTIRDMFIDNGDSTWTVRFYNGGVADYVTVDRYLPVDAFGRLVYAGKGDSASNSRNELWAALAEKAYVQMSESGWVLPFNRYSPSYGYGFITNVSMGHALHHVSGQATFYGNPLVDPPADNFVFIAQAQVTDAQSSFTQAVQAGQLVGLTSKAKPVSSQVKAVHSYVVTGYNAATGKFTLYQPMRTAKTNLTLTWNEIVKNFDSWDTAVTT